MGGENGCCVGAARTIDKSKYEDKNLRNSPLKSNNQNGLLILDFGDSKAPYSDVFPGPEELKALSDDPNVRLQKIESKHKSGYTPLSGIRLHFTNGTSTPWFQTDMAALGSTDVIDTLESEVDPERAIREISIRMTQVDTMCALKLSDEKGEDIVDIEWENFDLCREWKAF